MFDLTRRSENYKKFKHGDVYSPNDLESNIVVDDKLVEEDLSVIEKEVNRANRKRIKDLKHNAMIPAANRASV